MSLIRFSERMTGRTGPVPSTAWRLPARGPHGGDGIPRLAATTTDHRPDTLELRDLHVDVHGIVRERDGYRATLTRGHVVGLGPRVLDLECGFADILTRADGGRRMHYRLLVVHDDVPVVIDGVKVLRGGVGFLRSTTTLATAVIRVDEELPGDDRAGWLSRGDLPGQVVGAGDLRVRGLLRQGLSLRGDVPRFLGGFVRRALRP